MWSVVELQSARDEGGSIIDLTLAPGARYKLIQTDELNLRYKFQSAASQVVGIQLSNHDPM